MASLRGTLVGIAILTVPFICSSQMAKHVKPLSAQFYNAGGHSSGKERRVLHCVALALASS